jgi:hypothetical protein
MNCALPMALPMCPSGKEGHGRMHLRPPHRQSKEQLWCGVWYDCDKCTSSTCYQSQELRAFLASFTAQREAK